MMGDLLAALGRPCEAAATLALIGDAALVERVRAKAASDGVAEGECIAATVRHVIDHADEAVWLDLLGRMSGSPQPGAAALEAILTRAFPAERVRIRRTGA